MNDTNGSSVHVRVWSHIWLLCACYAFVACAGTHEHEKTEYFTIQPHVVAVICIYQQYQFLSGLLMLLVSSWFSSLLVLGAYLQMCYNVSFSLCTCSFWPNIFNGKQICVYSVHMWTNTYKKMCAWSCSRPQSLFIQLQERRTDRRQEKRRPCKNEILMPSLLVAGLQGHLLAFHCWKTARRLRQLKLKRFPPCPHTN